MNIVEKAQLVAIVAHAAVGQKRKHTGEDYIVHPAAVASLVKCAEVLDDNMVAAAWLHDVVEDTDIDIDFIHNFFGSDISDLVSDLTDVSKPEDGNREQRKAIDREHTAKASPRAKTIKICDLIHNTRDIVKHDRKFAKVYIAEKELLMPYLADGDSQLFNIAFKQMVDSKKELAKEN